MSKVHKLLVAGVFSAGVAGVVLPATPACAEPAQATTQQNTQTVPKKQKLDLTGRKRVGKASFYARNFGGRKMADGTPMNLHGDNAASKTLPLGTTAKVTNLETGQSAVVKIQDRGPCVQGRIVDLSPSTAEKVGITPHEGVAKVEVAPISVPLPDGSVKPGQASGTPIPDSASTPR
jgi:rare lipoprotein A